MSTMLRPLRTLPLLLIALLWLGGVAQAWAQQAREGRGRDAQRPQTQQERDSLSDSVRRVQRDTRGQVLSAERVPFDGHEVHRVKVLDDSGRVRVYMDDPRERKQEKQNNERTRRPPTRDDDD